MICGPGLVNIYQFTHDAFGSRTYLIAGGVRAGAHLRRASARSTIPRICPRRSADPRSKDGARSAARRSTCSSSAYGAEAGNLALRTVATAGVYVGGGIAPKILPAFDSGLFLDAFRAKEPMAAFVATIPVAVILNSEAGLLGAAVHANAAA